MMTFVGKQGRAATVARKVSSTRSSAGGGQTGSPSVSSGCTATVCLIRDSAELAVAHVGDSRALLCRKVFLCLLRQGCNF